MSQEKQNPLPVIGFIGCGNMARGLMGGFRAKIPEIKLLGFDPVAETLEKARRSYALEGCRDNPGLIKKADWVILAVKPQALETVVAPLAGSWKNKKIISILAGVTCQRLRAALGGSGNSELPADHPLLRLMPNLNAQIGQSATGAFFEGDWSEEDKKQALDLVEGAGVVKEVAREELLHAVTGLAGSGPAYVYAFAQALAEAGTREGLPYPEALELALQTIAGSAQMLRETGEHPHVLRNRVTSPGGTTIHALAELEKSGWAGTLMEAVAAAARRSREL